MDKKLKKKNYYTKNPTGKQLYVFLIIEAKNKSENDW